MNDPPFLFVDNKEWLKIQCDLEISEKKGITERNSCTGV